jgi:regulator of RNase E activity RraB
MSAESFIDDDLAAQIARNEKLLEVFREQGADLGEERPIDFFFYTGDHESAEALANDLWVLGFSEVIVGSEARDGKWSVTGVFQASVERITDKAFVESLVRVAAKYLAEFDGWGAPV